MDKDFSKVGNSADPRFNTKTDRIPDRYKRGPEETYIEWDLATGKYVTRPGRLPPRKRKKLSSSKTKARVARLAERDSGMACFWCDCELSYEVPAFLSNAKRKKGLPRYPTVDHVIELANGGPDTDANCVLSCGWCNNQRNKTFDERRPES
jgi:5-methylcytosine-specific restriction endonuclease McrA